MIAAREKDVKPKVLIGEGYANVTGKVYRVNNSVIFGGKPIGLEEFPNQMVEVLGIIVDRVLKEDLVKWTVKP